MRELPAIETTFVMKELPSIETSSYLHYSISPSFLVKALDFGQSPQDVSKGKTPPQDDHFHR